MPQKIIPTSAISVQSAKPDTPFGQLSILPLSNAGYFMCRAALTGIPANATITSAVLQLRSRNNPWSGSRTIKVRAMSGPFSTASTWNQRPGVIPSSEVTLAQSGTVFGAYWNVDVTAIVQSWVSGTVANNGVIVFSTETTAGLFQGVGAAWGAPALIVNYTTAAVTPTGLHPSSGAVSIAKPTLAFQASADMQSLQVQIDPAANGTTPAFDSGEVAATAGLLDLTTTAYAGLADGASTQWRARIKNSLGWSAWSSWVAFSRAAWKTATVTSPTSTSEDPSPVVTATYGGTITAWRVLLLNSLGGTIEDSGWTPGTTVAYGTTKSVGASGSVIVQIRDNVLRDTTPGDPDYVQVTKAFTVAPSGTPAVLTGLAASSDGIKPDVVLTATRAGGVPDEVVIYRHSDLIARVPGASVFSGTTMTYRDRTAPMNVPATYAVFAVVNGAWSNTSNVAAVTPSCTGVWVLDVASDAAVLLLDVDDPEQTQPEIAIVHRPVSGPDGVPQVVRRRLSRYQREGSISGTLVDALGISATDSEAALRAWAENDAGHRYRLVQGDQNDQVLLGDIDFGEVSENGGQNGRVLGASFNWWCQA